MAKMEFYKGKNQEVPKEEKTEIEKEVEEYWSEIKSKKMLEIRDKINKLPTTVGNKVLISGKSGTGKTGIAESVHIQCTPKKRFTLANCTKYQGTDVNMAKADLFGIIKGAATGVTKTRMGVIEESKGGTLFLDEIHHLPFEIQLMLLDVLDEKPFKYMGGNELIEVKCNFIFATNENLEKLEKEGSFAHDLLKRLWVSKYEMPSLKERKVDFPGIVLKFFKEISLKKKRPIKFGLKDDDVPTEIIYDLWDNIHQTGELREVKNTIERSIIEFAPTQDNDRLFTTRDLVYLTTGNKEAHLPDELKRMPDIKVFYNFYCQNEQHRNNARAGFNSWYNHHIKIQPEILLSEFRKLIDSEIQNISKNKFNLLIAEPGATTAGGEFIKRKIKELEKKLDSNENIEHKNISHTEYPVINSESDTRSISEFISDKNLLSQVFKIVSPSNVQEVLFLFLDYKQPEKDRYIKRLNIEILKSCFLEFKKRIDNFEKECENFTFSNEISNVFNGWVKCLFSLNSIMDNFIKSFDATSQQANNKRYDHEFSYDHKMVKLVKNRLNDINSKNIEFIDLIKVTHQFEFKKYLEFDDDPLIIDGLR